jgi:hypothetical protein
VLPTILNAGTYNIVTLIGVLGLSQPFIVWLTYHVDVPTDVSTGTGAIADPVPVPVADVYHSRLLPVAVSGPIDANWQ